VIEDPHRLQVILGRPELGWLVRRIRRRLEQGKPLTGTVSRRDPSPEERSALEGLLGRRPSAGATLRVSLPALQARFAAAGICDDLAEAVRALGEPVRDRPAEAARQAARWAEMDDAVARAAAAGRPWLAPWWARIRDEGLLSRLTGRDLDEAARCLRDALTVIAHLPAAGAPLPELAAATLGDSHALDRGQPAGTLVLRAAAAAAGMEPAAVGRSAAQRAAAWAHVGVDVDAGAGSVLALNLPVAPATRSPHAETKPDRTSLTTETLALHAAAGEPARLTLRQLLRHPPRFAPARGAGEPAPVFVCENPAVVAAAAHRLGPRCAPLLCTEGQPRAALWRLLEALAAAGATFRVRADFDWAGVSITRALLEALGPAARPWRMSAADYEALAPGPPLSPRGRGETPWDPGLADAMARRGHAVHEEALLPVLLRDLGGQ
jgi:uncharacterized protein (TIGR02679 family)